MHHSVNPSVTSTKILLLVSVSPCVGQMVAQFHFRSSLVFWCCCRNKVSRLVISFSGCFCFFDVVSQSKGSLVPLPQVQVGEKELDALLEEKPFSFSFDDTNCHKENKNKNKSKTCIAEGSRYWFQISSWVTYLLRVFE